MPKKLRAIRARGKTFFFKYDKDAPELLHIYVRHLTSINDVLSTFFNIKNTNWNEDRKRYESSFDTHTILWFYLDEKETKIMIISCFKI